MGMAMTNLPWLLLDALASKAGPGFFLLDLERFRRNHDEFLATFHALYPRTRLGYSYKTNYTPRLCRIVHESGAYAEVVSGMEYELARRLDVPPSQILFNGPFKGHDALQRALAEGATVHLDSLGEVDLLESLAPTLPNHQLRLGLRCNFPVGEPQRSRFGIDALNSDLETAITRIRRIPNCDLAGLHCHFSTPARTPESYALRTRELLALARHFFPDNSLQYLDIGGGFFSHIDPRLLPHSASDAPPPTAPAASHASSSHIPTPPQWNQYAEAVAGTLAHAFPNGHGPELILEPGAALVADVQAYVARILDLKTIGPRTLALAAGSIHTIKPTLHTRNMPLEHIARLAPGSTTPNAPAQHPTDHGGIDIVGYTCMEHDCLHAGFHGPLAIGDFVLFPQVGAYTTVMKPPFIQPAPPILALHSGDCFEWLRHRERTEDLFATYHLAASPALEQLPRETSLA